MVYFKPLRLQYLEVYEKTIMIDCKYCFKIRLNLKLCCVKSGKVLFAELAFTVFFFKIFTTHKSRDN
jgi:hypothetical protein